MLLAKALSTRKAYDRAVNQLIAQASADAIVCVGVDGKLGKPQEDPNKTMAKVLNAIETYHKLVADINNTNAKTVLENGLTLAQAIVKRDCYIKYAQEIQGLSRKRARTGEVLLLDTATTMHIANQMAQQARELDELIQKTNWVTELVEE